MGKLILFVVIIVGIVVLAFVYLSGTTPSAPENIDDATTTERCAEFRDTDPEDEETYSLGYTGRIRQFLSGCY